MLMALVAVLVRAQKRVVLAWKRAVEAALMLVQIVVLVALLVAVLLILALENRLK